MSDEDSRAGFTVRKIGHLDIVKPLADVMLMARDLSTCSQLLDKIEEIGNYGPYDLVREAFCWSILVKLVSCFKYQQITQPYRSRESVRASRSIRDLSLFRSSPEQTCRP